MPDVESGMDAPAHFGRRVGQKRCVYVADTWGQRGIQRITGTGIDIQTVVGEYAFCVCPTVKVCPVVGTDEQGKIRVRPGVAQCAEGVPGVGRAEQCKLEVGGNDTAFAV